MRLLTRQDAKNIKDLGDTSQVCVIAHLLGFVGSIKQEVFVPTQKHVRTSQHSVQSMLRAGNKPQVQHSAFVETMIDICMGRAKLEI